ncbi:MAG: winged helix-turn-helix domain-containing protein [Acidobacteriaceae bacterium]|nr:winged helix-turn-helix domain-containing protein [Acidobacteriaceae bacterium]
MPDQQPDRQYRFGLFEADAATGELRRQGVRVKLNAQPFQMLLMLLARPGELLTREEIARELWPDGTFVDYEHGVNSAVNRIREAIGDTAGNPRFIETLARRGYRFVAPVQQIGLNADSAVEPPAPIATPQTMIAAEAENKPRMQILATPQELPPAPYPVVQTIFVLLQFMYMGFYIGALANLAEIEDLFSVLPHATLILIVMIVTAAILIPARAFILCAVLFRAPRARQQFLRMWQFLLPFDWLWSLSPFLLLHHMNFGLALACTALLMYSPFAQRSLVLMGAGGSAQRSAIAG